MSEHCCVASCPRRPVIAVRFRHSTQEHVFCAYHDARGRGRHGGWRPDQIDSVRELV